ncbi:MAG TPA: DegT/DnrJ/EryC1/StrS family aminotransferase, partial [Polyangiaceae bacterium]
ELRELARRDGLMLLEDAAQAHGARGVSRIGDATAFSFYPSKNLGAVGDGGAIVTDDDELAGHARRLRDLGRLDGPRHLSGGYNERLDGLQAAALRIKLRHLDDWNAARRALAAQYASALADTVELLDARADCVYHLFPVRVGDRDELARRLAEAGIGTGVHYPLSLPEQPALPALRGHDAPVARDWAARELSLPMFPELTHDELSTVAEAITRLT